MPLIFVKLFEFGIFCFNVMCRAGKLFIQSNVIKPYTCGDAVKLKSVLYLRVVQFFIIKFFNSLIVKCR